MIVFTMFFLSTSYSLKKGGVWVWVGVHSFKSDVKIPKNISNYFSYSLGQGIRPSIFIKAPTHRSKYL